MNLLDLPLVSTVLDAAYRALMGLSDLLDPLAGGAAAAAAGLRLTRAGRARAGLRAHPATARTPAQPRTVASRHASVPLDAGRARDGTVDRP